MTVDLILFVLFLTFFIYGIYIGQRKSEKINDQNIKTLIDTMDEIQYCDYLDGFQKEKLSSAIIKTLPPKQQKIINKKVEEALKKAGL